MNTYAWNNKNIHYSDESQNLHTNKSWIPPFVSQTTDVVFLFYFFFDKGMNRSSKGSNMYLSVHKCELNYEIIYCFFYENDFIGPIFVIVRKRWYLDADNFFF